MTEAIITIIISGLFSIGGSLIMVWAALKKAPADTAAVYQEIANKQGIHNSELIDRLDKLEAQVDDLKQQIEERDRLIVEWQDGITRLIQQLETNQIPPVWRPRVV